MGGLYTVIYDDLAKKPIAGIEKFPNLVPDPNKIVPLSFLETMAVAECSAEISMSCYAGALMLQGLDSAMMRMNDRLCQILLVCQGYLRRTALPTIAI